MKQGSRAVQQVANVFVLGHSAGGVCVSPKSGTKPPGDAAHGLMCHPVFPFISMESQAQAKGQFLLGKGKLESGNKGCKSAGHVSSPPRLLNTAAQAISGDLCTTTSGFGALPLSQERGGCTGGTATARAHPELRLGSLWSILQYCSQKHY